MLIGIDGRSISHPRRGGFKTYIENLVTSLQQLPGENRFAVFYDRVYQFQPIGHDNRFSEHEAEARFGHFGQVYREHISIPRAGHEHKPDLWHFPYNTAPVAGIADYVLTLHDITAFSHSARIDWSRPGKALRELGLYYYPRLLISRAVRRARLVITVSNYAKKGIVARFGVPAKRVIVTPLAAQSLFRPLRPEEKSQARHELIQEYDLNKPFILSVASSLLKNPQGSIAAFARLPERIRQSHDLVIVMAHERFRGTVEEAARRRQVHGSTKVLVDIEPEKLLSLYNVTECLLYPSFTESFPLPTAEAMACGTPIICSNSTGFPEQVGTAAILVDPTDSSAIAGQLELLLSDGTLATKLRVRSLQRARRFSWLKTAELTGNAYELALGSLRSQPDGGRA